MLSVFPLLWRRRKAHLESNPTFLLFLILLFLTPLRGPLLHYTCLSVLFILLILLHVRQAVDRILNQWAETLGHHPRVGVQDGGQVGFRQLLPVMESQ